MAITVTLPPPYTAQIPIIKACFDSESQFIVFNGSRQVGKTLIATLCAIKWALDTNNQCVMVVSPTDGQVKKIYKQMVLMLIPKLKPIITSMKASPGDAEITFNNGSTILFRSAQAQDTLRGYSNTHLILDEAAFISEETWNTILAPSLTVKGKKTLFTSTPKGNNFFARLYDKGLNDKTLKYKSFKLTYHQNPFANVEFILEQEINLPDEIFRQEYLGEFIDAAGCFRNVSNFCILNKIPYKQDQYYIGVDIALKNDYTVAVCLNSKNEMVDYIRFNNTDTMLVASKLKEFFIKWKATKIQIEDNNQGLPIIQMLRSQGVNNIEQFHTDISSKPLIINALIAGVSNKEIKLLNDEIVKSEFNAFTATLSKVGKIKYAAAYGHDDIVMATAIAFNCGYKTKYTKSFVVSR